jgi:TPR repeat protein
VGGDAQAQYDLGVRYTKGKGVDEDAVEAVKWYRAAAAQDFALAKYSLGEAYEYGAGVPQDQIEAVAWYRKAANEGTPEAQLRLGAAYKEGRGVPRDNIQAHKWANLAAANAKGQLRETAVRLREMISWVMTPAQVTEAERLASQWRPEGESGR